MRTRALAGALSLVALSLAACGSGDERAEIEATITTAAMSDDPADCRRFSTIDFLEQSSKLRGEAAVEACEETAVDPAAEDPESVTIVDLDADGPAATASVRFDGSVFDGQTVRYGLIRVGEDWKFDEILGFVDLDASRLVLEFGRDGLRRAVSAEEARLAACVIGLLDRMDERELEAFFVDYGPEQIREMAESCLTESQTV